MAKEAVIPHPAFRFLPRAAHAEPMLALFAGRRRRRYALPSPAPPSLLVRAPEEDDQPLSRAEAPPLRHSATACNSACVACRVSHARVSRLGAAESENVPSVSHDSSGSVRRNEESGHPAAPQGARWFCDPGSGSSSRTSTSLLPHFSSCHDTPNCLRLNCSETKFRERPPSAIWETSQPGI